MIKISIPSNNIPERKYILDIFFNEFLGLSYRIVENTDIKNWEIELENGSKLIIEDHFFYKYPKDLEYLKLENIPSKVEYIENKFTPEDDIPIIYGSSRFEIQHKKVICGIDIFASSFFMLTRWEEYVNKNRDSHNRFPATQSLAFNNNFLDRPVVNEYIEMLKSMILYLDGTLKFKQQEPKTFVSCDVDTPYEVYTKSLPKTIRKFGGDLIKRKSLSQGLQTLTNYTATKWGNYSHDPMNTFDWIMDVNENAGNRVAFYFLVENTVPEYDAFYNINEPRIRKLLRNIHQRGHEIGLHGSYSTYQNGDQLKNQVVLLRKVMEEENINQQEIGIRQHYLRWSTPETARIIDDAGLTYDTTLGYADYAGFRCGTCYEYPLFDLQKRQQFKLRERPLVLMEASVLDDCYMGLNIESAEKYMLQIKNSTKKVNGNFTLLWHNSYFDGLESPKLYKRLI